MKKLKQLFIFLSLIISFNSSAFTYSVSPINAAANDLKKVREYYKNNPLLTVETNYMAFDEHDVSNLKESKNGFFAKNANSYYTKILNIETLSITDMIINIDHDDKRIVIGDNDAQQTNPFTENMDSLLLMCTSVDIKNVNATEKKYIMDFSENEYSEFDRIEFYIDIKNYRFNRIVLCFRAAMNLSNDYQGQEKKPRLEIGYKNYKTAVLNKNLLEKNNYIQEVNEKIVAVEKYKKYKIVDQRRKSRIKEFKKVNTK